MSELTQEMKDQGFKLFKNRPGEEARLTADSGHIQLVGDQFVPVHPMFHRDAYANGCFDEETIKSFATGGAVAKTEIPTLSPEQRKEKILEAIIAMSNAGDPTQFTGAGVPKADVLSGIVGFNVPAVERDAVYQELQAEKD